MYLCFVKEGENCLEFVRFRFSVAKVGLQVKPNMNICKPGIIEKYNEKNNNKKTKDKREKP